MKKIEMYIDNCSHCPYSRYDGNYGMSYDSGFDCSHDKGGRIIDDWAWDNTNNPNRLNLKRNTIPTPDWCPLEDANRKDKLKKIISKLK